MNRFITGANAERVRALERANLEAEMREGYLAERERREEDLADWELIEVERWPE